MLLLKTFLQGKKQKKHKKPKMPHASFSMSAVSVGYLRGAPLGFTLCTWCDVSQVMRGVWAQAALLFRVCWGRGVILSHSAWAHRCWSGLVPALLLGRTSWHHAVSPAFFPRLQLQETPRNNSRTLLQKALGILPVQRWLNSWKSNQKKRLNLLRHPNRETPQLAQSRPRRRARVTLGRIKWPRDCSRL